MKSLSGGLGAFPSPSRASHGAAELLLSCRAALPSSWEHAEATEGLGCLRSDKI